MPAPTSPEVKTSSGRIADNNVPLHLPPLSIADSPKLPILAHTSEKPADYIVPLEAAPDEAQRAGQDAGLSQVAKQKFTPIQDPQSHLLAQASPNGKQPQLQESAGALAPPPNPVTPSRRQAHNQTLADSPDGMVRCETAPPPAEPADNLLHRHSVDLEPHQRAGSISHQANRHPPREFDQRPAGTHADIPTCKNQDEDPENNGAFVWSTPGENLFRDPFLHVVDVPLDGSEPSLELLAKDAAEGIDTSLRVLRQHPENVARIFDYTIDKDLIPLGNWDPIQESLIRHLDDAYGSIHADLSMMLSGVNVYYESNVLGTDPDAIYSQLNQSLTSIRLDRIWTRTTLRQDKDRGQLEFCNSSFCCVEVEGTRLLVIVVNYSRASSAFESRIRSFHFSNPRLSGRLLSREAWARLPTEGPKICAATLTLDFLLTCVYMQPTSSYSRLLGMLSEDSKSSQIFHMLLSFRHQNGGVPRGEDSEINLQIQECEQILQEVQQVTEAILFLLAALNLASSSPGQPNFESLHRLRYLGLRETCSHRRRNCERRIERINRTLETRNKLLNIHESTSVKRLTILAAMFLPASLASSFLSMSQRFHELKFILFDWLGVFVLISSVTIALYFAVKVILHVKSNAHPATWSPVSLWALADQGTLPRLTRGLRVLASIQLFTYLAIWAVVLACFVLGMFRSPSLGGKVLGYGIGGVLGLAVLGCFGLIALRMQRGRRTIR